ncbi:hypothetical protein LR48_Vigan03g165900 [Vigna angularis]|uniref:Uncharacterized protein n=3 Tax=Phaseolus angularis TaxID=3914 RepID=A0A0L9U6I6_PHAAN|nr:uncharacterized protein LOC108329238 isoform X1 [Vigna angularis]KOM38277.1 hypothetical protein LR48_Vigan03g165900 [Vigna angularis]BAT84682.1 hypothetical protein VIGAN_04211800 [Vigna angularis var. angularis]
MSSMRQQDATDTTTLSYWLNWRFLLCAFSVLLPTILAFLVIWKDIRSRKFKSGEGEHQREGALSGDEAWKPCLKEIHPVFLLVFRIIAFSSLLASLVAKFCVNGGSIFFYYTQWTFALITIYFGCASMLSVYGCYQYNRPRTTFNVDIARLDAEQGPYMPLLHQDTTNRSRIDHLADPHDEIHKNQITTIWSYIFQILFQMNAGAVMLTDCVYWIIIFPFLTLKDYDFTFMTVNMHTLNVFFLLGDAALNCLPVHWSGMSFFVLWTSLYVIFQWTFHAFSWIWWPYPFLTLSSPYSPLWYLLIALLHIPCYAMFKLIVEIKHYFFSKWFPSSTQF